MCLEMPKFKEQGYDYFNEQLEKWCIKEDAPDWAKEEFDEFMKKVNPLPDEKGIVSQY